MNLLEVCCVKIQLEGLLKGSVNLEWGVQGSWRIVSMKETQLTKSRPCRSNPNDKKGRDKGDRPL